jgi:uncharacterized protein
MNVALRSLTVLSVLAALTTPVGAAPVDDAITSYEIGNYPQALARLRPLADQGSAEALFYLAVMHHNGSGVPRDLAEAHRLYKQSAEKGYAPAQFNLAILHHKGEGVTKDDAEARRLYRLAADQSHARAQFELGQLYLNGQGGDADDIQAHLWFSLATASFPVNSGSDWRYKAQIQRNLAAARLTQAQIGEAEQLARTWIPAGAARQAALTAPETRTSGRKVQVVPPREQLSSGTGFFVSPAGHILTNAHVAAGCTSMRVHGPEVDAPAELLASDTKVDLSLVKIDRAAPAVADLRVNVRQGEQVAAYGFPLSNILASSGNFTTGGVTALAGFKDDANRLQISAPIQPGNSGGPLLDESGNVVGVVVSRLNSLRVARITGDISQNINFAIKGSEAVRFLEANGVRYTTGKLEARLSPSDLADRGRAVSVLIECKTLVKAGR